MSLPTSPTDILLATLAIWRVSFMLTSESGPANIFGGIRRLLGVRKKQEPKDGSLAELFTCVYCMSIWVLPVALLPKWVHILLSLSALAILFDELVGLTSEKRANVKTLNSFEAESEPILEESEPLQETLPS